MSAQSLVTPGPYTYSERRYTVESPSHGMVCMVRGEGPWAHATGRLLAASHDLHGAVLDGIECAEEIVKAWESGDLAAAVNALACWMQNTKAHVLTKLEPNTREAAAEPSTVVVEVSGGTVQAVYCRDKNVRVQVYDHDNEEAGDNFDHIDKGVMQDQNLVPF